MFSIQIPGAVDDEAVRIFLEFERVESAIKGKSNMCSVLGANIIFSYSSSESRIIKKILHRSEEISACRETS